MFSFGWCELEHSVNETAEVSTKYATSETKTPKYFHTRNQAFLGTDTKCYSCAGNVSQVFNCLANVDGVRDTHTHTHTAMPNFQGAML